MTENSITKTQPNLNININYEDDEILKLIIELNKPYLKIQTSSGNVRKEKTKIIPDKNKCKI